MQTQGMRVMLLTAMTVLAKRRVFGFVSVFKSVHRSIPNHSVGQVMSMSALKAMDETQLMQDMLVRVRKINNMPNEIRLSLIDFVVDGVKLGKVLPNIAQRLCGVQTGLPSPVFEMTEEGRLTLSDELGSSPDDRTRAVAKVMERLRESGDVTGWRDELFPVAESFYSDPVFLIERAAVSLLGIMEYGIHVNGLVREFPDQEPKMWIARRSSTKSEYPGMLDHIVAGGQPAGLSLMENVIKECEEEAGIPETVARAGIQAAGAISYESWHPKRNKISRVVLFNYDLYLPTDFVPKPVDGEVEEFILWSIDQTIESIALDYADPIKPNCYVVIIDYLLRMGYMSPEVPGYLDVLRELRSGDCR